MTRRALLLATAGEAAARPVQYNVARLGSHAEPPAGLRVSLGWRAAPLATPLTLHFARPGQLLRITTALDSREVRTIEVSESEAGKVLGGFELRFAPALQTHELRLPAPVAQVVLRQVSGKQPTWILSDRAPAPLLPHFLAAPQPGNPVREFSQRLRGLESLQPFGWMEGCVLDALADLRDLKALDLHLRQFLPSDGDLRYEDPLSHPADNKFLNIEETLPIATIARRRPKHAVLDLAIDYWRTHADSEGCVINGLTSTEGSYTVAYPMAVLARLRRDRTLEEAAIRQLRLRRDRLTAPDAIFLRRNTRGQATFRNWSRGVAWYLLGLVRTLDVLADRSDLNDLRDEAHRAITWILSLRPSDSLWNCFVDDPSSGAETSGSAGIAAAIAIATRLGLHSSKQSAQETWTALERWLTPDGFLTGVAQSNRGGEALQRSSYRVMSPMAMGLMGQLAAALKRSL